VSISSPPEEPYHSCILRKCCKPAFLHPEEEMQDRSAIRLMSKMLSKLFPSPNKGANQTSSPKKAHEFTANKKTHLTHSWDIHKSPSFHPSSELLVSRLCCNSLAVAFPFSLINPTLYILVWLII
jgi:hypothetical protein